MSDYQDGFESKSTNERLSELGIYHEFYRAIDCGDIKRVHEILDLIRLPESKKLWPQPSGRLAIYRKFAGAQTDEEVARRESVVKEFEAAKQRADYDALRSIFLRLGIKETSLEWPLDARPPRT